MPAKHSERQGRRARARAALTEALYNLEFGNDAHALVGAAIAIIHLHHIVPEERAQQICLQVLDRAVARSQHERAQDSKHDRA